MIIRDDYTWHNFLPKQTEAMKLMVLALYNRPHMQTQEAFKDSVTLEGLARNPKCFTRLMNVYHPMQWGKSTDYANASMGSQGYISLKDDKPWGDDAKKSK